jgi:hypothetical protein
MATDAPSTLPYNPAGAALCPLSPPTVNDRKRCFHFCAYALYDRASNQVSQYYAIRSPNSSAFGPSTKHRSNLPLMV